MMMTSSPADRLRADVAVLAAEIGERHVWRPAQLADAAEFIARTLAALGYAVQRQTYRAEGQEVCNLIVELAGRRAPEQVYVVGAHYDSRCGMAHPRATIRLPGAPGTPGANDNASGVAALLELARRFAGCQPARTLRLVAFVNEEHPFFQTALMGSRVYAASCRQRGERIAGMLALDDLGCYTEDRGTQRYPFPYNLALPTTGNFLAFLSNLHSRAWQHAVRTSFRQYTALPTLGCSVPALLPRIGWSDDWAFWQEGYLACAVTDTAYLRYPHYHTPEDTPDRLNYPRMAKVVEGMSRMLGEMIGANI